MTQDIKETKYYRQTDNLKTVYTPQTHGHRKNSKTTTNRQFVVGIITKWQPKTTVKVTKLPHHIENTRGSGWEGGGLVFTIH